MLVPRPELIPTRDQVLELLKESGAWRQAHVEFPDGSHSSEYFQMPLAMRYQGNARLLNVALSRLLRLERGVLAALPDCAIVAPAAGGISVAFGVREALIADQVFWAEKENGKYFFRQYLEAKGLRCILVDDVVRRGRVINYMVDLIHKAGAEVVAVGSLVHFNGAHLDIGHIPYRSLIQVDTPFFPPGQCPLCRDGKPVEKVWA